MKIKRWHLYLVNLNPKSGPKPGKIRPCLCIRPDYFSDLDSSVILPITSQAREDVEDLYPTRLRLNKGIGGLTNQSDLLVEQILAWENKKFIAELGILPEYIRSDVNKALREFLGL